MKKFISLIIALATILLVFISAYADVDLKSMDVNDLNELRVEIENEILSKGGDVQIASGKYKCGKDLAEGSYELKLLEDKFAAYNIYDSNNEQIEVNYLHYDSYVRVTIEKGMTLEISHPCFIRKAAILGF